METWCEHWNIKINEDKTRGIYFPRSRRPPDSDLTLNGRNIPFLNSVKNFGVVFDKKVTWRLHMEILEAKQLLQNKFLLTIGNFRDLHKAFKLPYDYITTLCRKQAEIIQNHENANVCNIGQGEPRHKKYKRLKLGGGQAYDFR
jgi:hypothetical protein